MLVIFSFRLPKIFLEFYPLGPCGCATALALALCLYDKCSSSLLLSVVERGSLDPYTRDNTQGSSISGVTSSMQHNFPSKADCLFHAICVIRGCTLLFIVGPFNYLIGAYFRGALISRFS